MPSVAAQYRFVLQSTPIPSPTRWRWSPPPLEQWATALEPSSFFGIVAHDRGVDARKALAHSLFRSDQTARHCEGPRCTRLHASGPTNSAAGKSSIPCRPRQADHGVPGPNRDSAAGRSADRHMGQREGGGRPEPARAADGSLACGSEGVDLKAHRIGVRRSIPIPHHLMPLTRSGEREAITRWRAAIVDITRPGMRVHDLRHTHAARARGAGAGRAR